MQKSFVAVWFAGISALSLVACESLPEEKPASPLASPPTSALSHALYATAFTPKPDKGAYLPVQIWETLEPVLKNAAECREELPNSPEVRLTLKGQHPTTGEEFAFPVSEQYFSLGGNFRAAIVPTPDFRVFGHPVRYLTISRTASLVKEKRGGGRVTRVSALLRDVPAASVRTALKLKGDERAGWTKKQGIGRLRLDPANGSAGTLLTCEY